MRAWDVARGVAVAEAALPASGWDVALLDDDRVVAVLTDGQQLLTFRAADLSPMFTVAEPYQATSVAAAGDRLLVADQARLATVDVTGAVTSEATFTNPAAVSLAPVGAPRWLVVGGVLGDTSLFTWPALAPVRTWRADVGIIAIEFRPDGALVASAGGRVVRLWDPASGRLLAELDAGFLVTQLAWSPDGTQLAVAGASGTVLWWRLTPPDDDELAAVTACVSPWQLADAVLVARPFDPARCAALDR